MSSRIFVSNLSHKITENELRHLFQDYGEVEKVELKIKDNASGDLSKNQVKAIAFITLKINPDDLSFCIDELSCRKLHGSPLKVSIAKESFLDRLKREREESAEAKNSQRNVPQYNESTIGHFALQNNKNTRRTFADDENFDDIYDIAPELMITKKCASNSIFNGKIVIQNDSDVQPLHVIEHKTQTSKQRLQNTKINAANEKRKKSLLNMKDMYQQQKSAIQNALAGMDMERTKKIRFDDAEAEESECKHSKTKLFTDDAESDEDVLLPEYKGHKSEKLVQLRSKQSLDPRFKINENFIDDDDDDDTEKEEHNYENQSNVSLENNERDWQFGILEQVTGHKIHTTSETLTRKKAMMHYDPSKEEHNKYLRQNKQLKNKDNQIQPNSKSTPTTTSDATESSESMKVSKEVFYIVNDNLKESLKSRDNDFSLLNMFGSDELNQREQKLQTNNTKKILIKKSKKNDFDVMNLFNYDSSASEDETDQRSQRMEQETSTLGTSEMRDNILEKNKRKDKVKKIMHTYFVPKNDIRLKEGARMFKYSKNSETGENYEVTRNRLKILIKTKITKSKKNLSKRGIKLRKKGSNQFR